MSCFLCLTGSFLVRLIPIVQVRNQPDCKVTCPGHPVLLVIIHFPYEHGTDIMLFSKRIVVVHRELIGRFVIVFQLRFQMRGVNHFLYILFIRIIIRIFREVFPPRFPFLVRIVVGNQCFRHQSFHPGKLPGDSQRAVKFTTQAVFITTVVRIGNMHGVRHISYGSPIIRVVIGIHGISRDGHLCRTEQVVTIVRLFAVVEASAQTQFHVQSLSHFHAQVGTDVVTLVIPVARTDDTALVHISDRHVIFHFLRTACQAQVV